MRGRRTAAGVLAAALLAALLGSFSLAGCSPDAAERRESAERHLAEGRTQEALLELRSAHQAEPNDAQTNFRIAEIAEELGAHEDARLLLPGDPPDRSHPQRRRTRRGATDRLGRC